MPNNTPRNGIVLAVERLPCCNGTVYDLNTSDGTFVVNDGAFVAKNTDSIYTVFSPPGMDRSSPAYMHEVFAMARNAASAISQEFPHPVTLEFEKVMCPFMLYTKKRYSYCEYTTADEKHPPLTHKGFQVVRRDTCQYTKDAVTSVLESLMVKRDTAGAIRVASQCVRQLLSGDVPIDALVVSKSLSRKAMCKYLGEKTGVGEDAAVTKEFVEKALLHKQIRIEQTSAGAYLHIDGALVMSQWGYQITPEDQGGQLSYGGGSTTIDGRLRGVAWETPPPEGTWRIQAPASDGTCELAGGARGVMREHPCAAAGVIRGIRGQIARIQLKNSNEMLDIVIPRQVLGALPHVALAYKLQMRDSAGAPRAGERVPYIFVKDNATGGSVPEDPAYAAKNGLLTDRLYYFENHLKVPLETVLQFVCEPSSVYASYVTEHRRAHERRKTQRVVLGTRGKPMSAFLTFFGENAKKNISTNS